MVNWIWQRHFGRGIVSTPDNFGFVGDRPTDPELLEYLASRLVANNWSIKTLHREIMLSATYQLSSDFSERDSAIDPDNRLHWRTNHRRLDAEAIRDALLFVSGNLDSTIGGPSTDLTPNSTRRTIYSKVSRFKLDGMLAMFDFPEPTATSAQRNITNVPRLNFWQTACWRMPVPAMRPDFRGLITCYTGERPALWNSKLALSFSQPYNRSRVTR
jgi:hypothetical protein